MRFKEKLEENIRQRNIKNIHDVIREAHRNPPKKWLDYKIKKEYYDTEFGKDEDEIIKDIRESRQYASKFAIDARNQGIQTSTQLEYIREMYPLTRELTSRDRREFKYHDNNKQTINFYDPSNQIYFVAKYSSQRPGNQKRQIEDIEKVIDDAKTYHEQTHNSEKYIIVIDEFPVNNNNILIQKVQETDLIEVCTSDDFL